MLTLKIRFVCVVFYTFSPQVFPVFYMSHTSSFRSVTQTPPSSTSSIISPPLLRVCVFLHVCSCLYSSAPAFLCVCVPASVGVLVMARAPPLSHTPAVRTECLLLQWPGAELSYPQSLTGQRSLPLSDRQRVPSKWHHIPYIVHSFLPRSIRLWSKSYSLCRE